MWQKVGDTQQYVFQLQGLQKEPLLSSVILTSANLFFPISSTFMSLFLPTSLLHTSSIISRYFLILVSLLLFRLFSTSQSWALWHKTSAQCSMMSSDSSAGSFILTASKIFSCYIIFWMPTQSSLLDFLPACHPGNSCGISAEFCLPLDTVAHPALPPSQTVKDIFLWLFNKFLLLFVKTQNSSNAVTSIVSIPSNVQLFFWFL